MHVILTGFHPLYNKNDYLSDYRSKVINSTPKLPESFPE